MKTRMSVARCCCGAGDGGTPPPQPGVPFFVTITDWGWWQPTGAFVGQEVFPYQVGKVSGDPGFPQHGYLIYGSLNLAQGEEIFSAEIEFASVSPEHALACTVPTSTPHSGTNVACIFGTICRLRTYAEDIDSAVEYATVAQLNAAARTASTFRSYNVATDGTAAGAWAQSGDTVLFADVTPLVQQVIDRAGWVPLNAIQFFIHDDGSDFLDGAVGTAWGTLLSMRDGAVPPMARLKITPVA